MQQENSLVQRSFGDEPCTEERTYYGELSMYGAAPLSPTEAADLRPTLLILGGTNSGQIFRLRAGSTLLGRDPKAQVSLDSARISRRHCEIVIDNDGTCRIRELGSTNGTRVNGRTLRPADGYVALGNGDRLDLGGSVALKFGLHRPDEVQHHQSLYESAHCDSLTGAYNKRHLMTRLEEEFAWARRQRRPLSMIVLDLDHFKSVNDTYGHAVGDVVLKRVAATIRLQLRREDIFGRFGGEEFVILMRDTPLRWSQTVAERIRSAIARSPITYAEGVVWVTTSLGFATTEETGVTTSDELFAVSDERLYAAKAAGRDRAWGPDGVVKPMSPSNGKR